jgi:subtilisin family serine protease
MLAAGSIQAEQRVIVRALGGQTLLNSVCVLLGCNVVRGLDDPLSQTFLVTIGDTLNLNTFISQLSNLLGIVNVEPDRLGTVLDSRPPIPPGLYDNQLITYFGTSVRSSYVDQPAAYIVKLGAARSTFEVSGAGIVAVIDTGVDPNHPVLQTVLLPGYDYTRNHGTASEMGDVNQSTAAVVDGVPPTYVNARSAAVVDQSTAAVVDDSDHAAFGHGTMVSGIIHLVAPTVRILPLKAFGANGSGYTSDILRAVYRAVRDGAGIINMSFSMPAPSTELKRAINYATGAGTICVSSAGNQGQATSVYPAAWSNVIGVASTDNADQRSVFSNYGQNLVWLAAPGEGVITTYPFGSYAAAWGTSFSTPFVSGTIGLLRQIRPNLSRSQAFTTLGHAMPLGPELGKGRLDIFRAVEAAGMIP